MIYPQGQAGGVTIDAYNDVGTTTTINWDVSGTSTNYEVTLNGAGTLNLTNVRNGDYGTIIVEQDGVGSTYISLWYCEWWRLEHIKW